MKQLENNKAIDHGDNFRHLPEELLIFIFTKLGDLKFFCPCSVVCKRFATIMSRVRTISLSLPGSEAEFYQSLKVCKLYQELLCVSSDEIPGSIQSRSIQKLNFIPFLMKFRELESIYLEFTSPIIESDSPFLKWKAKCGSGQSELESLVCVLSASVHKMTDSELDDIELDNIDEPEDTDFIQLCFRWGEWMHLLWLLVKCHISLKSVTITNSQKQGKWVLRGEQLIIWRNILLNGARSDREIPLIVKTVEAPVLHLPSLAGYVMKRARLMIMKFPYEPHASSTDDIDDILTWEYEEEEKVLGEAVKEILMNHRDRIMKCFGEL